jgi:putative photosynthetic complex assembly protein
MSDTVQTKPQETMIPKGALGAAIMLVLFSLVVVTVSRMTGVGSTQMVPPAVVESRDLRFADGKDGAVLVYDAQSNQLIERMPSGSAGFIRVVMRKMAHERKLASIGSEPPFRLARHSNGQVTITDTVNGTRVDLDAFGAANAENFTRLMTMKGGTS